MPDRDDFSEQDLERALRQARRRPPAALLVTLKQEARVRKPRRSLVPRVAIVALVTAGLMVSLGVAGALGYASRSTESLGHSLFHTVQAPFTSSGNDAGDQNDKGYGNGNGSGGDKYGRYPFHHEYGHNVPMCRGGRIVYVPAEESFYRMLHGYGPAPCRRDR